MLLTPLARGLLGWDPDAPRGAAVLAPQPYPAWPGFTARNLRMGESSVDVSYQRGLGWVEVELESRGPPVELTYVQSIPLGATDIRMEVDAEGGPRRQVEGRHDIRHEVTLNLAEGSPARLLFRWAGGLEVYSTIDTGLSPGVTSHGLRILDFAREEEAWVLTVEGDGGGRENVWLLGEAVETDNARLGQRDDETGRSKLEIDFPAEGPRVVRTLRLRPMGRPGE